ncbi:MAG: nitroreductase family protein [Bacteroidales bacterium]|nr:nitroreductase family protein [Bacteroidales bacterium]MDD3431528.1 nitroreductase family protein [Bacteroidales bacterium]MDD4361965.1 nitroreductase family protein [Bacteroidales bacterium]MDD4430304.1 nitroreductase family protein [Bacteroidales bacterium]
MDNFLDLLRQRRSTRKFLETDISPDMVAELMRAALMSPSSKRTNPWEFVLVEDADMLKKLSLSKKHGSALIEGASLGVVVIADKTQSDVWVEDASIAALIIQLQAESLGLGSCWVQIRKRLDAQDRDSEDYVRELLGIPEKYGVLCILALGMKAEQRKAFDESKLQWEKLHPEQFKH